MSKTRFSDEHLEEHQPFPTLKQALEILDPSVGFNIEIKWTMQLKVNLIIPIILHTYADFIFNFIIVRIAQLKRIDINFNLLI